MWGGNYDEELQDSEQNIPVENEVSQIDLNNVESGETSSFENAEDNDFTDWWSLSLDFDNKEKVDLKEKKSLFSKIKSFFSKKNNDENYMAQYEENTSSENQADDNMFNIKNEDSLIPVQEQELIESEELVSNEHAEIWLNNQSNIESNESFEIVHEDNLIVSEESASPEQTNTSDMIPELDIERSDSIFLIEPEINSNTIINENTSWNPIVDDFNISSTVSDELINENKINETDMNLVSSGDAGENDLFLDGTKDVEDLEKKNFLSKSINSFKSVFSKSIKNNQQISDIVNDSTSDSLTVVSSKNQATKDVFQELDFWELDFWELDNSLAWEKKKIDYFVLSVQITSWLFWLCLLVLIWFWVDLFIRTTNLSSVTNIPWVCEYVASSIEWYDLQECKTLPEIITWINNDLASNEDAILKWLSIIIPRKIQANFILASSEVKFIQEKTSWSRIMLSKMLLDFSDLRKKTWMFDWKNIECSGFDLDEKWDFSVSCNFYWSSILDWWTTSRKVALEFLDKLQSKNSSFVILEYPKSIDMWEFNSTDWIKSIFSTTTKLDLKLKYVLASKI